MEGSGNDASTEHGVEGIVQTNREAMRARMRLARLGGCTAMRVSLVFLILLVSCRGEAGRAPAARSVADASDRALEALRTGMAAADPAPILATFANDVQLHSPALISSDYRGRELVGSIVAAALQALEDVRVTDVLRSADGGTGGVVFDARIRELSAQGFVLVRTDGAEVREITLLLRPLPALRAFVERMGELGAQPALDARQEPSS